MKKMFRLEELDCAHCAAKLERAIVKLDGVQSASVNFLLQRLTLEAADERFDEVLAAVGKTARRVADCRLVE